MAVERHSCCSAFASAVAVSVAAVALLPPGSKLLAAVDCADDGGGGGAGEVETDSAGSGKWRTGNLGSQFEWRCI